MASLIIRPRSIIVDPVNITSDQLNTLGNLIQTLLGKVDELIAKPDSVDFEVDLTVVEEFKAQMQTAMAQVNAYLGALSSDLGELKVTATAIAGISNDIKSALALIGSDLTDYFGDVRAAIDLIANEFDEIQQNQAAMISNQTATIELIDQIKNLMGQSLITPYRYIFDLDLGADTGYGATLALPAGVRKLDIVPDIDIYGEASIRDHGDWKKAFSVGLNYGDGNPAQTTELSAYTEYKEEFKSHGGTVEITPQMDLAFKNMPIMWRVHAYYASYMGALAPILTPTAAGGDGLGDPGSV